MGRGECPVTVYCYYYCGTIATSIRVMTARCCGYERSHAPTIIGYNCTIYFTTTAYLAMIFSRATKVGGC